MRFKPNDLGTAIAEALASLERVRQTVYLRTRAVEYYERAETAGPTNRREILALAMRFDELASAVERLSGPK